MSLSMASPSSLLSCLLLGFRTLQPAFVLQLCNSLVHVGGHASPSHYYTNETAKCVGNITHVVAPPHGSITNDDHTKPLSPCAFVCGMRRLPPAATVAHWHNFCSERITLDNRPKHVNERQKHKATSPSENEHEPLQYK